MYRRTRYLNLPRHRPRLGQQYPQPAVRFSPLQRLQRLPETRAVDAFAGVRQELRAMGIADDQLAIGRKKTVLRYSMRTSRCGQALR